MPVCSGKTILKPKERTTLTCQMRYYNRQPTIRWLHNGELVEGTSGQDSGLSSHSLEVRATQSKDGSIYKCVAELDGITDECSLTLDVLCEQLTRFFCNFLLLFELFISIKVKSVTSLLFENIHFFHFLKLGFWCGLTAQYEVPHCAHHEHGLEQCFFCGTGNFFGHDASSLCATHPLRFLLLS